MSQTGKSKNERSKEKEVLFTPPPSRFFFFACKRRVSKFGTQVRCVEPSTKKNNIKLDIRRLIKLFGL